MEVGEMSSQRQQELEYLTADNPLIKKNTFNIPHPFFGFGPPGKTENLYFETEENFKKKDPNTNVLAIFGGSVADNLFALDKLSDSEFVGTRLETRIDKIINLEKEFNFLL